MLTLVLGGARSGKSRWAEELAAAAGGSVTYVATGWAGDDEMRRRIEAHRRRRPAGWETVEERRDVERVLAERGEAGRVMLVDCLTFLVFNLLEDGGAATDTKAVGAAVLARVESLAAAAARSPAHVIIVSDEVGWGIVPPSPGARAYRDLLGEANQAVAAVAQTVYAVLAGIPLRIKG